MATVYEIIQGLSQAAANAYDGALNEDGEAVESRAWLLRVPARLSLLDGRTGAHAVQPWHGAASSRASLVCQVHRRQLP